MHPATLHGVGVITKLYFAIFAAFKESIDLKSRSEVIQLSRSWILDFWYQSKARIHIFISDQYSIATWTLSCTVSETQRLMSKIDNFPYPTLIPGKIWGVPFGVDP